MQESGKDRYSLSWTHNADTNIGMDCTSRLTLTDPQGNDKLCSFIPSLKICT